VTNEFYDKIKNLTSIIVKDQGGEVQSITFKEIKDLSEVNTKFDKIDEELSKRMAELRTLKKTDPFYTVIKDIEKEIKIIEKTATLTPEDKADIKNEENKIKKFSKKPSVLEIKNKEKEVIEIKKEKNKILEIKRELEKDGNCIIKQSRSIDAEIFEQAKETFKEFYGQAHFHNGWKHR